MARTTTRARTAGTSAVPAGPSRARLAGEALAGLDALRLLPRVHRFATPRTGHDPRDVLVLPGWFASDTSTVLLRGVLARDGHRVRGWEQGRHRGELAANVTVVTDIVRRRAAAVGGPIDLVGQSLGGVLARAVARRSPGAVRRVITLGTPLHGPSGTVLEQLWGGAGRERTPPPVPTTVIWSRRDGIVGWRAQLDDGNPWAEHVEVRSRHLGMGLDPTVLEAVRDRVAAHASPTPLRATPTTRPVGAEARSPSLPDHRDAGSSP